jgi:hypothetical protein
MRLSPAELRRISQEDQKIVAKLMGKVNQAIKNRSTEIQKYCDRIKELIDKKHEIQRAPNLKEEVLEAAKENFRNKRRETIKRILGSHLEDCQLGRTSPFNEEIFKRIFPPDKCWQLGFLIFTEKDIEETAAFLPDIGISERERKAKIKEIDQEIDRLSKLFENEL